MKRKYRFILVCIVILAAVFRFYGLYWDQGFHLHPDERAITMSTTPLSFPSSVSEFLSPQSLWNPHFFAYGSFPLYLLKIVGQITAIVNPVLSDYPFLNLLGRYLSTMFDLGTLVLIFVLGRKLFNQNIGFLATFFYAISVFPIQASHFYAVDTPLTFFVLLTLYQLIRFYEKPGKKQAMLLGFFFGFSLATKNSALVLLVSIGLSLAIDFLLIFLKNPHRPHIWSHHLPKLIKSLISDGIIIILITVVTFAIFEPYAFLDFREFWRQTMQQYQMTHDAFTFPYTLQYVGKIPYFYELKNIFLWGQGPILATISFLGTIYVSFLTFKITPRKSHFVTPPRWPASQRGEPHGLLGGESLFGKKRQALIILVFFWVYFLVVGKFAIGFMRYMLPLYPLLCLFGAVFFYKLLSSIPKKLYAIRYLLYACLLFAILWPLSFINIYTKPNTRVLASNWITKNIPQGKTIAIEHWDDSLPLFGQEKYRMLTLNLYDPENPQKWLMINQILSQTDYIIIASNRLYVPLQKLTDCQNLPVGRCYLLTAQYYKNLFSEQNVIDAKSVSFQKVAEFSTFPTLQVTSYKLQVDDSSADESFTVYDHPKVMIFKKTN